jgi:hypothetical protein
MERGRLARRDGLHSKTLCLAHLEAREVTPHPARDGW